ncbi:HAD family hydrolase [Nannocystaceae bacterium ST9]
MRYPVLIFDLDDTLIESFPEYARLHQRVARELGWPVPTREALVHYANTWEETLAGLFPERELAAFFEHVERVVHEHPYRALAGVVETLGDLRARGHSLWIVTKRSRARLEQRMREAQLDRELFAGIFAHEDQPVGKPDPRCFEPVWRALGGPRPEQSIYVGDRHDDRLAAQAAGLTFVGVRTGPEPHGFASHPREHVLDSAADLPRWLEAQS